MPGWVPRNLFFSSRAAFLSLAPSSAKGCYATVSLSLSRCLVFCRRWRSWISTAFCLSIFWSLSNAVHFSICLLTVVFRCPFFFYFPVTNSSSILPFSWYDCISYNGSQSFPLPSAFDKMSSLGVWVDHLNLSILLIETIFRLLPIFSFPVDIVRVSKG